MGDQKDPSTGADKKQQRTISDSQEQSSEKPSKTSSSLGNLLNPNQAPSQQSNDNQGGSKGSGSGSKKPKAIEDGSGQPSVDKSGLQVQRRGTQAGEGDTARAATSSDSKTQGNDSKSKSKSKSKQKAPEPSPSLARFQDTQGKVEDKKPLDFMTELQRIENCADDDFFGILGFPSDGNNIDPEIRVQRHMRLTMVMHPDKVDEEFRKRANAATQSKRKPHGMLEPAEP